MYNNKYNIYICFFVFIFLSESEKHIDAVN